MRQPWSDLGCCPTDEEEEDEGEGGEEASGCNPEAKYSFFSVKAFLTCLKKMVSSFQVFSAETKTCNKLFISPMTLEDKVVAVNKWFHYFSFFLLERNTGQDT
jgi:hypothetical protein